MRKTFILDTNVILFDPHSIFKFAPHDVLIPLICIEELDKFKKDQNENGRNARAFSRIVDELRRKGPLAKGVSLENGGKLIIGHWKDYGTNIPLNFDLSKNDNLILAAALILKSTGQDITLITKDINLRLKADVLGIVATDYITEDITLDELYTGHRILEVSPNDWEQFRVNKILPLTDEKLRLQLASNEYVEIFSKKEKEKENGTGGEFSKSLFGRYSRSDKAIVSLLTTREGVWGIYPKNKEQHFAFDALLNNEFKLVSLVGKAGTGKTLLAMAAGLEMSITKEKYSRVLVSRPIQPMGRDLGFLPGDIDEKIAPWMWPILMLSTFSLE